MTSNPTVYRVNKRSNLTTGAVLLAIIFCTVILPILINGEPVGRTKVGAIIGILVITVFVAVAPFGLRLEVGKDYVKNYLLGFCFRTIQSSRV